MKTAYVEFVHQFKRRIPDGLESLRFGLSHRYTVEHHLTLEIDTAIDAMAERSTRHTRRQKNKLVDLTAATAWKLIGQFLNDLVLDCRTELRLGGVKGDDVLRYIDRLFRLPRLKHCIDPGDPGNLDSDAIVSRALKAGRLDLNRVSAWDQVRELVVPAELVVAVFETPVASLLTVTVALGTMPPVTSVTVPVIP